MKVEDVDLALYIDGMHLLGRSGIFRALALRGRVRTIHPGAVNYQDLHVKEVGRSEGYCEALDDLLFFRERYLSDEVVHQPVPDYGGLSDLVASNRITKEEADDLRRQLYSKTTPA